MPYTIIDNKDRGQWLKARTYGIGGSDASAIVGMNPYKTNIELFEEKTGRRIPEDISEKPYVKYGNDAEPLIRALFALDYPEYGSVSDHTSVRWFTQKGKIAWEEGDKIHGFDGVPASEYVENKERTGIFEPVLTMINAYNKAISEKANDVDYFADAYLKVLGALLDEEGIKNIRDDRVINFDGDASQVIVEFLQKPDGDTTQEHLIDRLERLIFVISMVANISDENFGTSSGIAMKYKLQAMSNLEKTKERKFTSGMNRRYRLIFSNPVSGMKKDDWVKVHPKFTPNFPANLLEETQIAQGLDGIVSQDTQLGVLSIVENVQQEKDKIEAEQQKNQVDPIMQRMFGGTGNEQSGVLEEAGNGSEKA